MPITPKMVGTRIKRREDPRLITGQAIYTDDLQLPGMLYMSVLRSIYAHAAINSIDITNAKALAGVVAVYTGADIDGLTGPVPCVAEVPGMKLPHHPLLAVGKVRYVGEPVAVVIATSRYVARDATDLIEVEYDALDAVVDPEKAAERDSVPIHETFGDNIAFRTEVPNPAVEQALKEADTVVKLRIVQQRLVPMAMEPRATVAQWDRGTKQLTVWSSTQIPHLLRTQIAEALRLPENHVRVIAPEVGGGFGAKLNVYREELMVPYFTMKLGKPVKWTQARREDFAATIHGRGQVQYIEAAVKKDGTVTAMKAKLVLDLGAYFQFFTPMIPSFTGMLMHGAYKVPAISFEQIAVFTNKMATDAYRGAGRPEAAFIAERVMDAVATELKLDPVDVRRKNFIPKTAFPYATPAGLMYDSGNYEGALDKALQMVDYVALRKEQEALRKQGRYIGIGLSSYIEICGLGPSVLLPPKMKAGGWESCTVRVDPAGTVTVFTGISPHGQGQETSFAQMVADELGVGIDDVVVLHGDTGLMQYGIGTFGSRGMALGGTSLKMSLDKVKEKARKIASHLMEAPPESLEFGDGKIFLKSDETKAITFQQVVEAAYGFKAGVPNIEPGLEATSFYEPSNCLFPFGTHIAVVEVDADTGDITFRRYIAVDDCGNIINPMLVEGQVHGGIAQGIAQALYEEVVYDENGQLLTGSLMDYAVPKAAMMPWMELDNTVTPTPVNPLGVKGVGEAGTIGSTPAVVNAVLDALAPFGVKNIDMPLRPERVWRAIQEAKGGHA
ncbi:MAG: xanthine dehydrogenase family protein molybdopterin-binding subunit [Deltaproteobacteria bacterium]|nr:xanthine dehydrogenase family protein molybdopterin-binding subunit [Deltaproteobacteria bacterium]